MISLVAAATPHSPLDSINPSLLAGICLFLPAFAVVVILGFTIDSRRGTAWTAGVLSLAAVVCAELAVRVELHTPHHVEQNATYIHFFTGQAGSAGEFTLQWGVLADPLAAVGLGLVTGVGLIAVLIGAGTMRRDPGFIRFMASLEFAVFAATGVVVATNYFELFVFWSLLTLAGFLGINHWWRLREVAAAARRAVLVMSAGDALLLGGILYLFFRFHELNFGALALLAPSGRIKATGLLVLCLLIFGGAAGKAALVPLHAWIADATHAPTPAFALILGTLMPAGAYMIARTYDLMHYSEPALTVMAVIGGITAVAGGLFATFQDSLRRRVAFAGMAQLGIAVLGLGIKAYGAAIYHVVLWGLTAALLALAAGTVVAVMRTESMREMGGLWRRLPSTRTLMVIGALAGAGLPPFGLFWTTAAILARALATSNIAAAAALLAAVGLCAVALVHAVVAVFGGETARRRRFDPERIAEPGGRASTILWLLAIPVVLGGLRIVDLPVLGTSLLTFLRFPGLPIASLTPVALLLTLVASLIGSGLGLATAGRRIHLPATGVGARAAHAVERELGIPLAYGWTAGRVRHWVGLAATVIDRRGIDPLISTVPDTIAWLSRVAEPLHQPRQWQATARVLAGLALLAILAAALSGHAGSAFG